MEPIRQGLMQAFLASPHNTKSQVRDKLAKLYAAHDLVMPESVSLGEFYDAINNRLKSCMLDIAVVKDEETGKDIHGLQCSQGRGCSIVALEKLTGLEPSQSQYLRVLIDTLVQDKDLEKRWFNENDAILLCKKVEDHLKPPMTSEYAALTLRQFIEIGLFKSRNDPDDPSTRYLFFGPRMLVDMRLFIEKRYEEDANMLLPKCSFCDERILMGLPCSNDECDRRLHYYCAIELEEREGCRWCPRPGCNTPLPTIPRFMNVRPKQHRGASATVSASAVTASSSRSVEEAAPPSGGGKRLRRTPSNSSQSQVDSPSQRSLRSRR